MGAECIIRGFYELLEGCTLKQTSKFGVVTRFANHVEHFDLSFWEVKDVGGGKRAPHPGTIPMVSCFGDNRVSKAHPEWVQVDANGLLATRDAPYFDWDCLCPSQTGVQSAAMTWIEHALSGSRQTSSEPRETSLRLDDVNFAREGYCECEVCKRNRRQLGMDFASYRQYTITSFVEKVRPNIQGELYFTLFPDPYPGHLENRFGVQVDTLKQHIDAFVVPIYDLAYSTTYWLEVLAQGFQDRLENHPWYLELYGLGVEEDRLIKAAQVASKYSSGVLLAYDNNLEKTLRIRDAVLMG